MTILLRKHKTFKLKVSPKNSMCDHPDKYAFCLIHELDTSNKTVVGKKFQVDSQVIKDLLEEVIQHYPDILFNT